MGANCQNFQTILSCIQYTNTCSWANTRSRLSVDAAQQGAAAMELHYVGSCVHAGSCIGELRRSCVGMRWGSCIQAAAFARSKFDLFFQVLGSCKSKNKRNLQLKIKFVELQKSKTTLEKNPIFDDWKFDFKSQISGAHPHQKELYLSIHS